MWLSAVLGAALFGVAVTGCSDATADLESKRVGVPGVDASISFESKDTLTITPGETVAITVIGKPQRPYAIKFLLVGDALDASLSQTDVVADDDGRATVALRAPNTATYFAVRATIKDGPSANLSVAVGDEGFGTLAVNPIYAGTREKREWVASVVTGTTCEALKPTFPTDPEGPPPVTSEPGDPILIEDVPVGPNLAVFVRAGHYMWGCTDASDLVANGVVDVKVHIYDKPLDLDGANLEVSLGLEPDPTMWNEIVNEQRASLVNAFTGRLASADMLLLAMESAYSGDVQDFTAASTQNGWLAAIDNHFITHAVDLETALAMLVDDGLSMEPSEIRATLAGVANAPQHAILTLLGMGSASPAVMNVPAEYVVGFTADADDTLRVGGTLFWMPSRYFGHVATQAGLDQHPTAADFDAVLAEIAVCDELVLEGLSDCDAACVSALCATALSDRWSVALGSSADVLDIGELTFESVGKSRFDDQASVTGFTGTWLGEATAGNHTAKFSGAIEAEDAGKQPPAD